LPTAVVKKHKLLKRFKRELTISIVKEKLPSYFLKFETIGQVRKHHAPIFVENIRIKKKAVLFWLSNGSVQVNLAKCCVILTHRVSPLPESTNLQLKVWIFDEANDLIPREFMYDTDLNSAANLDQLPIEAVQAIKLVHEANLRHALARRKESQTTSPVKRQSSPLKTQSHPLHTMAALQEKAQSLRYGAHS
jgi:hypothetical protein